MPASFFSDDPVEGTADSPDRLGRVDYADHVVTVLERVRRQSESGVLALIAPWGAGKSSVLNLTTTTLRTVKAPPWVVAEFNPWSFNDLESLLHGFFTTLRAALPKDRRWNESRRALGQLGQAVSPLGKLAVFAGVDASGIAKAASKLISGDTSAAATQRKAEEALRELCQPILIVLDDLDRLAPPELLLVMKLVRLVGRLPNVYYLLAYDEKSLKDVLRRTDLVGDDESRAADYLEKIVQVRLDLPPLRDRQIGELVDAALEEVLRTNEIQLDADATYRLQQAYHELLRLHLTTPRAINRFFAQVDAFYALVRAEVDFADFMLVTWFRTTAPALYNFLQKHKADLTGTNLRTLLGQRETPAQALTRWQETLGDAGVAASEMDATMLVLGLMFLPIRSARENMTYGDYYTTGLARRKGIGHVDYFDRYFSFGVPGDDIADSTVAQALQQLAEGRHGDELSSLRDRLVRDNDRVMRKLLARRETGGVPAKPLLELLAELFDDLPERAGLFVVDPRWNTEYFGRLLLRDIEPTAGPSTLDAMSRSDGGLTLAARIVVRLAEDTPNDDDPPISWLADAKEVMVGHLRERLENATATPIVELPDDVAALLMAWRRLDDGEEVRTWLRSQRQRTGWNPLDVLAKLVPVGSTSGGGPPRLALGELDAGTMDLIYGLDWLLDVLGSQIPEVPVSLGFGATPTPENRQTHVLNVLCAVRKLRNSRPPETPNEQEPQPLRRDDEDA